MSRTAAPQATETRDYLVSTVGRRSRVAERGTHGNPPAERPHRGHARGPSFGFGLLSHYAVHFSDDPDLVRVCWRLRENSRAARGFMLSSAYVLAMALAYAALGIAAAWSGHLQIALQTLIALGVISLVFVVLALSMFGFYDLQLPARWVTAVWVGVRKGGSDRQRSVARLRFWC